MMSIWQSTGSGLRLLGQVEDDTLNQARIWKRLLLIVAMMMIGTMVLAACGDDDEDPTATTGTGAVATTAPDAPTEAMEPTEPAEGEATEAMEPTEAAEPTEAMEPTEESEEATESTGGGDMPVAPEYDTLTGSITADGSSTVAPVAQAAAEEFSAVASDVEISVATSGTGGGFESFCAGDTDFSNASRAIADDEIALCEENGVEYTELHIATDALTVVVNSANDWVECITIEELAMIWGPDSTVANWSEVNAEWPDQELSLYGPGTDSGTFDYFTDAINGEEGASRSDYTASEDDNVLVQGVAGEEGAMGYFGYAYYQENQDTLKALEIDNGDGCVAPTPETAVDGTYAPLSRPLYMYVANESLSRPEVYGFVYFLLTDFTPVIDEVGYVSLTEEDYMATLEAVSEFAPTP